MALTAQQQITITDALSELNAYSLADMVDCDADNDEAKSFLERIRDGYADGITERSDFPDEDYLLELADDAPSIWNHARMMELVGLSAYNRAIPDTGHLTDDIVTLAGYTLYEIAQELLGALEQLAREAVEDEDEDE